jgi:hypothetical protein
LPDVKPAVRSPSRELNKRRSNVRMISDKARFADNVRVISDRELFADDVTEVSDRSETGRVEETESASSRDSSHRSAPPDEVKRARGDRPVWC